MGRIAVRQSDLVITEFQLLAGQDVPLDDFTGRAAVADLVENAGRKLAKELDRAVQ